MERISLSGNNLKTLPEEIGACVALQELYLANNAKFSSLPSSAGHLRRLQELVLRKCPALKQLPASVAGRIYHNLTKCSFLLLYGNTLTIDTLGI